MRLILFGSFVLGFVGRYLVLVCVLGLVGIVWVWGCVCGLVIYVGLVVWIVGFVLVVCVIGVVGSDFWWVWLGVFLDRYLFCVGGGCVYFIFWWIGCIVVLVLVCLGNRFVERFVLLILWFVFYFYDGYVWVSISYLVWWLLLLCLVCCCSVW